jgi:hypothetical protein
MLGLKTDGSVQWLQLEPVHSLCDLADLIRSTSLTPEALQAVAEGACLPAIELHQQLSLSGPIRTAPAFDLDADGLVKAALFDLSPDDLPAPVYPYSHFLQGQVASRSILGA